MSGLLSGDHDEELRQLAEEHAYFEEIVHEDPYGGLTQFEVEVLTYIAGRNPELRERDNTQHYLKWGKWLVDHNIVNEGFENAEAKDGLPPTSASA